MSKKIVTLGLLLIISLFALVACGGQDADSPVVEEETAVEESVVEEPAVEEPVEEPVAEDSSTGGVRTFTIVPEESEASYTVDEEFFSDAVAQLGVQLGFTNPVGRTQEVSGELQIDLSQPSPLVGGEFVVNIKSLVSDQKRRDERIQKRFLESNQFPLAQFTATTLEGFPTDYTEGDEVTFKMVGDMTIREITQSVTFEVTAVLEGDTISGAGTANMNMSDYGFEAPDVAGFFTVQDEFIVVIVFVATE